jgi:hypothetical protein
VAVGRRERLPPSPEPTARPRGRAFPTSVETAQSGRSRRISC